MEQQEGITMSAKLLNEYIELCKLSGVNPTKEGLEIYTEIKKNNKSF